MVMGPLDRLQEIASGLGVNEIIVAMPSVSSARVDDVLAGMRRRQPGLAVKTLPPITKVFDDLPLVPDLMDSSLASLLNRDEFEINLTSIEKIFEGKTVLVTGAGGSIGSELCKQVLKFGIRRLVAVGKGEHSIYTLAKSLGEYADFIQPRPEFVYRIADVRDRASMEMIFSGEKPDIVFHAAAHKHVPLMEFNEAEALRNNVCGTRTVLEMASKHGIERFVLVSTDKAVNPSSIMGASKRLAELTAAVYCRERGLRTAVVRFGNVLGSRGSVVPLFLEQIRKGGPVTVTHPDMTRYFMSIPEAALLVINAAAMSEKGETFVLDMGSPYRTAGIAEQLIRMHGLEPGKDNMIEYTGLRPGEKIEEELFYSMDDLAVTGNKKIHVLKKENPPLDSAALFGFIEQCEHGSVLAGMGPVGLRKRIQEIVPEYAFTVSDDETAGSTRIVS